MTDLCPLKIWYTSRPTSLTKWGFDYDFALETGLENVMNYEYDNSTMHCPILLAFCMRVHVSAEVVELWNLYVGA